MLAVLYKLIFFIELGGQSLAFCLVLHWAYACLSYFVKLHVQADNVKFLLEYTGLKEEPLLVEHKETLLKLCL